jgi:hypothetical protein
MAWKTPAGQRKAPQAAKKKDDGSFPGLKVTGKPETKTPYEELQLDEVTALQAIYGDDFIEHKAAHSAWQVRLFDVHSRYWRKRREVSNPHLEIRTFVRYPDQSVI